MTKEEKYNKYIEKLEIELLCPNCGSDYIDIDSSRYAGISEISCSDCGFLYQRKCAEDTLLKSFYKKYKKKIQK